MAMLNRRRLHYPLDVDSAEICDISLSMDCVDGDESLVLAAARLEELGGLMSGSLWVLNNSPYVALCPCWAAKWKEGYFVIAGSFFFRFKSCRETFPDGSPIPIEAIRINQIGNNIFEISTIREKITLKSKSELECADWIQAINKRRLMVIKESMGHATPNKTTVKIDCAANKLYASHLETTEGDTSEQTPLL